ncbi:MAG: formate/nitrite transporter family protein [Rhodomicrobiaceae bacterium]
MTERGLDAKEREEVDEMRHVRAPVLYETIRQSGVAELERPAVSLWWSGTAGGLAISASIYCEGIFRLHLPDAAWRPLVENLGYTVGFLIVILSRFQLFAEQTVTAILPLLSDWTRRNIWRTARLWSVVLAANLTGAFAAAAFGAYSPGTNSEQLAAFLALSQHFAEKTFVELLFQGIPAGFLIAALAWMMPNSEGSKFWVIIVITYVIALGDFAHVVAGSVEVFLLLLVGNIGILEAIGGLIFPTLVGNILGGTVLFSVIAYMQISEEM